jgi:hypothetical protein
MANLNSTGVYQKENGFWEYRFVVVVDGKQIARKKSTDEFGKKLKTKSEAIRAREAAIMAARLERTQKQASIAANHLHFSTSLSEIFAKRPKLSASMLNLTISS